jgi:hypothetical protein
VFYGQEGEPMEDTQIRLLTKEFTLKGFSQPLMLCKAEDGRVLDFTEGQETYLRAYDGNDLFVRVAEIMDEGKFAVLEILSKDELAE